MHIIGALKQEIMLAGLVSFRAGTSKLGHRAPADEKAAALHKRLTQHASDAPNPKKQTFLHDVGTPPPNKLPGNSTMARLADALKGT
jgi:hypothetical protein